MKKNQVNAILGNQAKRAKKIFGYVIAIVILSVCALAFALLYIEKSQAYSLKYKASSDIDYNVYLKENEFFEDNHLGKDNQYIASLIDFIDANMNYEISMDEANVEYEYSYRIEAEVDVVDTLTKNSLYNFKEELVKPVLRNADSDLRINESLSIDYNHYNDLIKRFLAVYDLDELESTLQINMYVKVLGSCDSSSDASQETKVSLTIPLTTKTVAIDISSNLISNEDNILVCRDSASGSFIFSLIAILFAVIDFIVIVSFAKYVLSTRSASTIYEKELKKILVNYSSYIQKINSDISLGDYEVVEVDTFTDMLEIRDTIQQPILMIEDKSNKETRFMIPSRNNFIYIYVLKMSDIKRQMVNND